MRERIEELERRLGQNSSNSSMPPSTDPPMTRQQRRALARERAKKSLRKPGGQPGHEGKHRQMAPPEKVDETFECLPDACSGCGLVFTGDEAQAGEPVVHQKWELPPISPLIFEYRLHRVCCPAAPRSAGGPASRSVSLGVWAAPGSSYRDARGRLSSFPSPGRPGRGRDTWLSDLDRRGGHGDHAHESGPRRSLAGAGRGDPPSRRGARR